MNRLALRNDRNEIRILNRIYSTPTNDYDNHFEEVFDLKKGFWRNCFVWNRIWNS